MNGDTHLLRQIAPGLIRNGRLSSMTFLPSRNHHPWSLSVYNGDLITDADAITHYQQIEGGNTIGLARVTVRQCEELGLDVQPTPRPGFDSHCDINFPQQSWNRARKIARHLRDCAMVTDPFTVTRIPLNGRSS